MSIFTRLFARDNDSQTDSYQILRAKSFTLEFKDDNPALLFDGTSKMQISTNCYVVVNGISFHVNADFSMHTPINDVMTLEDIIEVSYFLPTRAALADGKPINVEFSHEAIIEIMHHIKTQMSYEKEQVSYPQTYLCI